MRGEAPYLPVLAHEHRPIELRTLLVAQKAVVAGNLGAGALPRPLLVPAVVGGPCHTHRAPRPVPTVRQIMLSHVFFSRRVAGARHLHHSRLLATVLHVDELAVAHVLVLDVHGLRVRRLPAESFPEILCPRLRSVLSKSGFGNLLPQHRPGRRSRENIVLTHAVRKVLTVRLRNVLLLLEKIVRVELGLVLLFVYPPALRLKS